jgi:aspartate/glutamate racemase
MLIRQADVTVPLFDTAVIHAQKAALLSIEP